MNRQDQDEPRVIVERSGGVGMLLMGLAIGAGLALLFAPQSGAETRRKIVRGARRMGRAAGDAAEGVSDEVGETLHAARERVAEHIDSAREAVTSKRGKVERAMNAGREAAAQTRGDLERRLAETKVAYQAGAQVAREQPHDD